MFLIDFIRADRDVYYQTLQNRIFIQLENIRLPIASLDDLIKMKFTSSRLKDQLDIELLQQAKQNQIDGLKKE